MKRIFDKSIYFSDEHLDVISELVIGSEIVTGSPLVTIVMPIYNHPDFLEQSLISCINQRCDFDFEVLIVDNNHPSFQKRNEEIISKHASDNLRYYVNKSNIGGVGNENRGVKLAHGLFVSFCHDDDVLDINALTTLIDAHAKCKNENTAILGNYDCIDEQGQLISTNPEWNSIFLRYKKAYRLKTIDYLQRNFTNGCGALYCRDKYLEIGGFPESFIPSPDYAFNVQYTSIYGAVAIRKNTFHYRMSSQSDSRTAYVNINTVDNQIKLAVLQACPCARFIPRFFLRAQERVHLYFLYKNWSSQKETGGVRVLVDRLITRIFRNSFLLFRAFRGIFL